MESQPEAATTADYSNGANQKTVLIAALIVLLIAALGFGGWTYSKMQDYKTNSDQKTAAAVMASKNQLQAQLQAQFDQQAKQPNKTFSGSSTYGSITFSYPKTWSAYVDTTNSSEPINGYFQPDVVPGIQSNTAYALRVELVNTDYSQVVSQFDSQISQGTVTSKAYLPPRLKGVANVVAGVYLTGQINQQDSTQKGNMVVIKVRDKTLQIYSESNDFQSDFNDIVLASLSFAP